YDLSVQQHLASVITAMHLAHIVARDEGGGADRPEAEVGLPLLEAEAAVSIANLQHVEVAPMAHASPTGIGGLDRRILDHLAHTVGCPETLVAVDLAVRACPGLADI